jgi:hypothetical protein
MERRRGCIKKFEDQFALIARVGLTRALQKAPGGQSRIFEDLDQHDKADSEMRRMSSSVANIVQTPWLDTLKKFSGA